MSEKGVIRSVIMEAVRIKGTQSVVASEAGMDGGALSKALSGEGSVKLEALEKIFVMAGVRVVTEQEHADIEALERIHARMILRKKC
jgi:DNA-binding phage protein